MNLEPDANPSSPPAAADPADSVLLIAVAPGDKLYDMLRRDRDAAMSQVAALEAEVNNLRSGLDTVGGEDAKATSVDEQELRGEIQQLQETVANLQHEKASIEARLGSSDASRESLNAELQSSRGRVEELSRALDEARAALGESSAWGHDLHAEVGRLRAQRSLPYKAVSRYRWEKAKRSTSPGEPE